MEQAEIWNDEYLELTVNSETAEDCQRKLATALREYVRAGGFYTQIVTSWSEDSAGNIIPHEEPEDNSNTGG